MSVEITGPGGTTSLFGNTVEVSQSSFMVEITPPGDDTHLIGNRVEVFPGAFRVEITSPGPQGPVGPMSVGDMAKSVYDPDDDGKVVSAVSADAAPWSGITGKPAAFPPETHTHTGVYSPVGHDHAGVYATASHNHDAVYSAIGHDHSGVYATASHSHAIADVTNLQTALNGKADTTHDHDSAYAALNHNHDAAYSPVGHDHSGTYATADHTHTGVYAAASHDHALDGLSDVTITTPSSGQVLSYDGSGWVNATAGGGSGDVVGPSSAQADGIPVFDGTTGKLLKDSLYRCTDFIRKNVGSGKGYLVGFSGPSAVSGIAPGTDGQVLTADSAQTLGVKWASVSGTGDMLKSVYDTDGDGKVNAAVAADSVPWSGVTDKPSTYPPEIHNHDSAYAALDHSHTGVYAPADHNHSGTYAPATHAHGNITSAGAIGSTSGLPVITTTSGVLTTGSFGSTSGTFAEGDHSHTGVYAAADHNHDSAYAATSHTHAYLASLADDTTPELTGQLDCNQKAVYWDIYTISGTTINVANGNHQKLTLSTTNITVTLTTPSGATAFHLYVYQSSTARTITWPTILWANGIAPDLTTASAKYTVCLAWDGTNWHGSWSKDG